MKNFIAEGTVFILWSLFSFFLHRFFYESNIYKAAFHSCNFLNVTVYYHGGVLK